MGWQYRKSVRLSRGIRLNISKRGLSSVSFGRPGSTINLGRRGVTSTVGIPGSGLSYRGTSKGGSDLLLGLLIGGLINLVAHAAAGNRSAQIALLVIGALGLGVFLSPRPTENFTTAPTTRVSSLPRPVASQPLDISPLKAMPSYRSLAAATDQTWPKLSAPINVLPDLTPTGSLQPEEGYTVRLNATANIRSDPSITGKVVGRGHIGEVLLRVSKEGRWLKVSRSGQVVGWVYEGLVSYTVEAPPRNPADAITPGASDTPTSTCSDPSCD